MAEDLTNRHVGLPIIYQGERARQELCRLELTEEIILESVRVAELETRRCTRNDPPSARGYVRWCKTVRGLRDQIVGPPQDPWGKPWIVEDRDGLPMTRHQKDRTKILVTSGTEGTGLSDGWPKTKNPKGVATAEAIDDPSEPTSIMETMDEFIAEEIKKEQARTWILLYYANSPTGHIYVELSNPWETAPGQRVTDWHRRILLPVVNTAELATDACPECGAPRRHG